MPIRSHTSHIPFPSRAKKTCTPLRRDARAPPPIHAMLKWAARTYVQVSASEKNVHFLLTVIPWVALNIAWGGRADSSTGEPVKLRVHVFSLGTDPTINMLECGQCLHSVLCDPPTTQRPTPQTNLLSSQPPRPAKSATIKLHVCAVCAYVLADRAALAIQPAKRLGFPTFPTFPLRSPYVPSYVPSLCSPTNLYTE